MMIGELVPSRNLHFFVVVVLQSLPYPDLAIQLYHMTRLSRNKTLEFVWISYQTPWLGIPREFFLLLINSHFLSWVVRLLFTVKHFSQKKITVTNSDNTKSKVPEPLSDWAERVITSQFNVRVGQKKQHYNEVVFNQDIKPEFVFLLVISTGGYLQKDFFNWLKNVPSGAP